MQIRCSKTSLALLALAPLTACGAGGGGTTSAVLGLAGPGNVSVVTAEEETIAPPAGGIAPGASIFPANSDYVTDAAERWVYDPSMESLDQINTILTDTSMTAYSKMVNYGPYVAQIVPSDDKGSGGDDTAGQSAGAAEEFELFTVNSTRATNSQPQIVEFWVPNDMDGMSADALIFARMILTEGATPGNPFGSFHLDYAAAEDHLSFGSAPMIGMLETNDVAGTDIGFGMYSAFGDVSAPVGPNEFADLTRVNVTMSADQTTGAAKIERSYRYHDGFADSGLINESWQIAFNDTHFKRQADAGPVVTLSRSDFVTNVWQYNLYHNEGPNLGQRVDLNSGFGFDVGTGQPGWIGYWGFWVPEGVSLTNGQVITEQVYGDELGGEYTVVKAPGKLIRHSKNSIELADIGSTTFNFWNPNDSNQYLVAFHDGIFWKTATFDQFSGTWTPLMSEDPVDMFALGGWLSMWSDKLGGQVTYIDGSDYVTYYAEEFINGASGVFDSLIGDRLELFGYFDCLKSGISTTDAESGDIYLAGSDDLLAPHIYRFDQTDLTLYHDAEGDDSNPQVVGLGTGQEPTSGPNMWGMHSGPMVTDTSGLVNTWDIWNLDEFYTYETGHNEWNQYGAIKDSLGEYVVFDPPMQFLYTHSTAGDRNDDATYDSESYFLNYNGPGDLWGIPSEGVDLDNDSQPDRWYPIFSLKDGLVVGPTGTEYVVRAIAMEQTLAEDPGAASSLDVAAADGLVLPTLGDYTAPAMGAKPVITGPPAVVDGKVKVEL